MGVRIFNYSVVLLTVFLIQLAANDAASINAGPRNSLSIVNSRTHYALRHARQAYSDEDESDEEDEVAAQNLVQQQQQLYPEDSQEDSDEDGDDVNDDDSSRHRRRRRDATTAAAEKIEQSELPLKEAEAVAVPEPLPAPVTSEQAAAANQKPAKQSATTSAPTVATTPATPARNTSVLILIRDALKKVTTLPTEQVATNALQYFQLFEHFIQQTIEDVIGDDDDDDDEAAAAAAAATAAAGTGAASISKPEGIFTPEEEEIIAGVEEILKEPELVTKQPPEVKPSAETQMELTNGAVVAEGSASIIGETKPAPVELKPEVAQEASPAANTETTTNSV